MGEVRHVETWKIEEIDVHNSQLRVAVRGLLDILANSANSADMEALRETYAHTEKAKD